jgi:putative FmdB family regulatory protein
MPLYEYLCDACGHRFERIQKFSDPIADVCPKCGGVVHKLVSSPAIQFKGSGFYITDYAKKDHVAAAKADSASGNGSGSESKSEGTKSEASKTETTKSETTKSETTKSETKTDSSPAPASSTTTKT